MRQPSSLPQTTPQRFDQDDSFLTSSPLHRTPTEGEASAPPSVAQLVTRDDSLTIDGGWREWGLADALRKQHGSVVWLRSVKELTHCPTTTTLTPCPEEDGGMTSIDFMRDGFGIPGLEDYLRLLSKPLIPYDGSMRSVLCHS